MLRPIGGLALEGNLASLLGHLQNINEMVEEMFNVRAWHRRIGIVRLRSAVAKH